MSMVEVKTADLIGPALDWAVSKADLGFSIDMQLLFRGEGMSPFYFYSPSTRWGQGGPLIDKYGIELSPHQGREVFWAAYVVFDNDVRSWREITLGPSSLIAACRAIVAAKLGDVVSVPAELVTP